MPRKNTCPAHRAVTPRGFCDVEPYSKDCLPRVEYMGVRYDPEILSYLPDESIPVEKMMEAYLRFREYLYGVTKTCPKNQIYAKILVYRCITISLVPDDMEKTWACIYWLGYLNRNLVRVAAYQCEDFSDFPDEVFKVAASLSYSNFDAFVSRYAKYVRHYRGV